MGPVDGVDGQLDPLLEARAMDPLDGTGASTRRDEFLGVGGGVETDSAPRIVPRLSSDDPLEQPLQEPQHLLSEAWRRWKDGACRWSERGGEWRVRWMAVNP